MPGPQLERQLLSGGPPDGAASLSPALGPRPSPLLPSPAFCSARAPRGQTGGGGRTEFPSAGAPASPQPGSLFLFTERKGKWKRRGGGGWRLLRRPSAGSDAVSQGPTRAARPGAHSSAPLWTTRHAPGPVALAPASTAVGPRCHGAPGSGGPATCCAPRRREAAAGALGPRGRAEAAGNPQFGDSGVSF